MLKCFAQWKVAVPTALSLTALTLVDTEAALLSVLAAAVFAFASVLALTSAV